MVDSEFWKATADMFSKLIEKPKMQEKFLKKPPPRYVYDMIIATMGVTNFPKGIFTDDEMNPKFFDESPQNKLEIFQKTIDITKIVLNENFEIKTTNICNRNNLCFKFTLVKGDEPEKTNFFLQAFHRAATSGKDFNKFISKYLEHKKKKAEEKKKATSDQKEEVKKEEPKKEPEKIKAPAEKQAVKETSKPSQPSQPSQPVQNTNNNQSNASTSKVSIARPQTPGKRPDKVTSEAKELKEEPKIAGKAPQGLISDKIKNQEEENKENNSNAAKSNNTSNSVKPKIKDDDLAPSSTGGKIKITSKIGKFTDLTAGDDTTKTVTKTFTQADLESIKNYVQDISKNSNPIGKIIDFLQDDIDSMNKELQGWIKESKTYKERYDEEVKRSDETLLPLQNELLELEETIRDEHMRIKSIKSRMIKNEQIIQNLINNVISIKNDK